MCDHCGKAYRLLQVLRAHVDAVHLSRERFKCDLCEWTTKYKHNIWAHRRGVHGLSSGGRGRPRKETPEEEEEVDDADCDVIRDPLVEAEIREAIR